MATDEQYEKSKGYLPPGWTEDMFKNPSAYEKEYDALTEEQWLLVRLRIAGSKPPAPPSSTKRKVLPAPCVEAIDMGGCHDGWGYTIIRTDYQDEQTWPTFKKRFMAIIEEQLTPENGDGIDAVKDALFFDWVEDKDRLSGADVDVVRIYCNEPTQESSLRLMTQPIVLTVDGAVIEALLNYKAREVDSEAPRSEKRKGMPWIWAIHIDMDDEPIIKDDENDADNEGDADNEDDEDEEDDQDNNGILKIALHSLINDFFPIVAVGHLGMEELLPEDEDDGVWHSIV